MNKLWLIICKIFMSELKHHRMTTVRVELKVVDYQKSDALLKKGWELAEEEDSNMAFGIVYLEKREMKLSRSKLLKYIKVCTRVDVTGVCQNFNVSRPYANSMLKKACDDGILKRHLITVKHARKTYEYVLDEAKKVDS